MSVCGLFAPIMCVLRRVVASRLAQSATGRQPTTGILLPFQPVTESTVLPSRGFRIVELRVQTAVFAVLVKPEVVVFHPEVVLRPLYHAVTCISLH